MKRDKLGGSELIMLSIVLAIFIAGALGAFK